MRVEGHGRARTRKRVRRERAMANSRLSPLLAPRQPLCPSSTRRTSPPAGDLGRRMGLPNAGSRSFQASPPDKGSFPLDHEGDTLAPLPCRSPCRCPCVPYTAAATAAQRCIITPLYCGPWRRRLTRRLARVPFFAFPLPSFRLSPRFCFEPTLSSDTAASPATHASASGRLSPHRPFCSTPRPLSLPHH